MDISFYCTVAAQFGEKQTVHDKTNKLVFPPEPSEEMRRFEQALPKPYQHGNKKHTLLCINGWLSPEGQLYPCRWHQHSAAWREFGFKRDESAINKGWIKLTQMQWLLHGQAGNIKLTEEQKNTISQWHIDNCLDTEYYDSIKRT